MITISKIGSDPKTIGVCHTISEANALLDSQPEIKNSLYQRIMEADDGLVIDYGSHVNFFHIKGVNYKEFINKFHE